MPEKKSDAGKAEDVEEKGLIPGSTEIAIIDERTIRDKIYVVRGVQVMLDFELAEIYGYTTSAFNRQVKNNAAKFEGEGFMFQLTREEAEELSRCNNYISIQTKGVKGGRAYLPHSILKKTPIPLPPLAEQKRIVAKLEELLPLCDGLKES